MSSTSKSGKSRSRATPKASRQHAAKAPVGKVFLADARNMLEIPDESIDLIVTSPPYFNIKDYSKDGRQSARHSEQKHGQLGDIKEFDLFISELLQVWQESFRVLKPNGKLIINVPLMPMLKKELNTHENRHIFDLNAEIQGSIIRTIPGAYLLDTYIWNRTNPSKSLMFGSYPYPTNFYAQNTIEFITVYVKAGKRPAPNQTLKERSKLTQEEWVSLTKQIWDIPVPNKADLAHGKHSAIMPEEIARRCIKLYSIQGDVVLDPFAGSGTTLRVAKQLKRKWLGYELVDEYANLINEKVGVECCVERIDSVTPKVVAAPPLNTVVQADCFDFLPQIPPESIDLACVDPPYNLGKADWDMWPSRSDFLNFTSNWLDLLIPTIRPGGSLYVFNTPQNAAYILAHLEKSGLQFQNWITWDKRDGFTSTRNRFVPGQEVILFFTKPGRRHTFNSDAVRIPYDSTSRIEAARRTGIVKNGKRWYPNENGKLCPDVWHITSARHKNKVRGRVQSSSHPTPKPAELLDRIILASSNPGDVVLDCFIGTGSTAVSARRLGRNFLGCEIDPEYVELSRIRLKGLEGQGDENGDS